MEQVLFFLAGFTTWNSIPHLVTGIAGQPHMTPFKRVSSPAVNVIWGFMNLIIGLYIFGIASRVGGLALPWQGSMSIANLWAYLAGAFALSLTAAWLFGRPNARLPWHKD